eukprot:CAMPEP_0180114086 /NCGR_PEP_ID=MMETSP0985-20121206/37113_1 /TAXON_ID=483367 /ORGANISM="non described non described, Strain CCMP 2436" /LENGTH=93 /DNA_ID=CAMNT_0022052603 /DNA_START=28 /DNA_END=309 /DNA_ORIENTATION=-
MVGMGAMLRQTTMVPSEANCMATMEEASMPTKSSGTVYAQRLMSSELPHRSSDGRSSSVTVVKAIWIATMVSGSGMCSNASLLKIDMPAEAHM